MDDLNVNSSNIDCSVKLKRFDEEYDALEKVVSRFSENPGGTNEVTRSGRLSRKRVFHDNLIIDESNQLNTIKKRKVTSKKDQKYKSELENPSSLQEGTKKTKGRISIDTKSINYLSNSFDAKPSSSKYTDDKLIISEKSSTKNPKTKISLKSISSIKNVPKEIKVNEETYKLPEANQNVAFFRKRGRQYSKTANLLKPDFVNPDDDRFNIHEEETCLVVVDKIPMAHNTKVAEKYNDGAISFKRNNKPPKIKKKWSEEWSEDKSSVDVPLLTNDDSSSISKLNYNNCTKVMKKLVKNHKPRVFGYKKVTAKMEEELNIKSNDLLSTSISEKNTSDAINVSTTKVPCLQSHINTLVNNISSKDTIIEAINDEIKIKDPFNVNIKNPDNNTPIVENSTEISNENNQSLHLQKLESTSDSCNLPVAITDYEISKISFGIDILTEAISRQSKKTLENSKAYSLEQNINKIKSKKKIASKVNKTKSTVKDSTEINVNNTKYTINDSTKINETKSTSDFIERNETKSTLKDSTEIKKTKSQKGLKEINKKNSTSTCLTKLDKLKSPSQNLKQVTKMKSSPKTSMEINKTKSISNSSMETVKTNSTSTSSTKFNKLKSSSPNSTEEIKIKLTPTNSSKVNKTKFAPKDSIKINKIKSISENLTKINKIKNIPKNVTEVNQIKFIENKKPSKKSINLNKIKSTPRDSTEVNEIKCDPKNMNSTVPSNVSSDIVTLNHVKKSTLPNIVINNTSESSKPSVEIKMQSRFEEQLKLIKKRFNFDTKMIEDNVLEQSLAVLHREYSSSITPSMLMISPIILPKNCNSNLNANFVNNSQKSQNSKHLYTIELLRESKAYEQTNLMDLMAELVKTMPAWNVHIVSNPSKYVITHMAIDEYNVPFANKVIVLDKNFRASVYINGCLDFKYCKPYTTATEIINLIKDLNVL